MLALVGLLAVGRAQARADTSADDSGATFDHRWRSLAVTGGIFGVLYGYTYLAWYSRGENAPTLHFQEEGWFGLDTYAGGADKLGHAWSNYALVRGVAGIIEWGGSSQRSALASATGMTVAFFVVAEIKDGYRPEYGFAWGDILFNLSGDAFGILMDTQPELDRRFDFRVEYWPSKPFRDAIVERGPFNSPEDYTGQRYFLDYHLSTIDGLQRSHYFAWSRFVDVSLGFQAAHFKPDYGDGADHEQDIFVGLTLNLQEIIDETLHPGTGTRSLRFAAEIVQIPFTTLRLGGFVRSAPDLVP